MSIPLVSVDQSAQLVAAVSATATILAMVAVLPVLRRLNVVDVPNARSSHTSAVPRGGGIACVVGVAAGLLVAHPESGELILPGVLLALLGLVDDIRPLSAWVRLGVQVLAAIGLALLLLAATADARTWVLVPGLLAVVSYVNAFNFMDGINGISSLHAAVAGGWFWYVGDVHDLTFVTGVGGSLCGSALAFLPWNAPRARVFLGDVGSYFLGGVIVTLSLAAAVQGVDLLAAAAPLTIYLADTGWTLVRRSRSGLSLTTAHRDHVYQQLATRFGHLATAAVVAGFTSLACLARLVVSTDVVVVVCWLGLAIGYLSLPRWRPSTVRRPHA